MSRAVLSRPRTPEVCSRPVARHGHGQGGLGGTGMPTVGAVASSTRAIGVLQALAHAPKVLDLRH